MILVVWLIQRSNQIVIHAYFRIRPWRYKNPTVSTINEQVFKVLGCCQNHQNQTFERSYLSQESWFENQKNYYTVVVHLPHFIPLLNHFQFFFTSMNNLFRKHSIFMEKRLNCFFYLQQNPFWASRKSYKENLPWLLPNHMSSMCSSYRLIEFVFKPKVLCKEICVLLKYNNSYCILPKKGPGCFWN